MSSTSIQVAVRYYSRVRIVSSTNIPCRLASQASIHFSILCHIAWYVVTCWDHCSINIWKTMHRSEFHRLSRTPNSYLSRYLMQRKPIFPPHAS